MPPHNKAQCAASDMYAVGVCLMLAYCPDLIELVECTATSVAQALGRAEGTLSGTPSADVLPLLQKLLCANPAERPSAAELLDSGHFARGVVPAHWSTSADARGTSPLRMVRLREEAGGKDGRTLQALRGALQPHDSGFLSSKKKGGGVVESFKL